MTTVRGKTEKVRGMNAALASESTKGLRERDPAPLRLTRKQVAVGLVITVIAAVAVVLTVRAVNSGQNSYPAEVTAATTYDLDFPASGMVDSIQAHPGEHVTKGAVLAVQDASAINAQIATDKALVAADATVVTQDQNPKLNKAQTAQQTLQIQQAQSRLNADQGQLTLAQSTATATDTAATSTVNTANSMVASDKARFATACPNGVVPPPAGLTGSTLVYAQNQFTFCENAELQTSKDEATFLTDQAQVPVTQAQQSQAVAAAQAKVTSDRAALQLAQNGEALAVAPGSASDLAEAQSNLANARLQLTTAEHQLGQTQIVAPHSGVIAEVAGAPGEYLGPTGVPTYQGPNPIETSSPGFQLFPVEAQQGTSQTSGSDTQPLIELASGSQQVTAQIPEGDVGKFRVGSGAKVSISALDRTVNATVSDVVQVASRSSQAVTYDVVLNLHQAVGGLLQGMSASVNSD